MGGGPGGRGQHQSHRYLLQDGQLTTYDMLSTFYPNEGLSKNSITNFVENIKQQMFYQL